jgi:hypothetical protein
MYEISSGFLILGTALTQLVPKVVLIEACVEHLQGLIQGNCLCPKHKRQSNQIYVPDNGNYIGATDCVCSDEVISRFLSIETTDLM